MSETRPESRGRRPSGEPVGRAVSPARVAAARALLGVERGLHVEDLLAEEVAALSPEDRRHAWFLALGVLRRRGHVDAALRPNLDRPIGGLDAELRVVLRLGAFELGYGRVGSHAVVHQAVELARAVGAGRGSGLVNAVLRRVRAPERLSRSERLDHPAWLVARWDERYGPEATERWCEANNEPPPLVIVGRDAQVGVDLQAAGLEVAAVSAAGRAVPLAWRVSGHRGQIEDLPGFREGRWWVQDPASAAVADLVRTRGTVLDACAAPGGKTWRLASQGAKVTATDLDPRRIERLREQIPRIRVDVDTRVHDWESGPMSGGARFDAVLVDAPCTGLGTVGRHPEIRWRRTVDDLGPASALQLRILTAASAHVRPGGELVYSVCSAEPEEGIDVVRAFAVQNPEFSIDETFASAPPAHGEDGFFGARLVRA